MSLTIGNPYSSSTTMGRNSTMTSKMIHSFEVDASSDQVEVSPLLTTRLHDQHSVSEQTVGEMPIDTPRSRQITSALSYQAKAILEEKRKSKTTYGGLVLSLSKSSSFDSSSFKEKSQKPNLAPWRELFEVIMNRMNQEIWQYERRTILADVQSVLLLLVATVFLYQFAGPTIRWSVFIIRRFSFPVACVYLIVPTLPLKDKKGEQDNGDYIS